jgi:hypothetical protein
MFNRIPSIETINNVISNNIINNINITKITYACILLYVGKIYLSTFTQKRAKKCCVDYDDYYNMDDIEDIIDGGDIIDGDDIIDGGDIIDGDDIINGDDIIDDYYY